MNQLFKQPLLHFLLLGSAFFLLFALVSPRSGVAPGDKTIVINRDMLLTFMQYRSQAFNRQHFEQQLDAMTKEERQQLINELVREEVMYREALALGLNDNDYVIKRRMVQKLEYLTRGFITAGASLSEAAIGAYYKEHEQDYYIQPSVTFTHVFFDYERHGREEAAHLARETLRELNEKQIGYTDAGQYGERFLYHSNYVERDPDYVAAHFGAVTAESIFALVPDDKHWSGPFESAHGLHLVLLTRKSPGRVPGLSEIHDRVRDDAEQDSIRRKTETTIKDLIKGYSVTIAGDLQ